MVGRCNRIGGDNIMDFAFSPEQDQLRAEVRSFVRKNPPERFPCQIQDEGYGFGGWSREYTRALGATGWLALTWPQKFGGLGRPLRDRFVLLDELAYHRAPQMAHFFNDSVGPSFLVHGTEEQRQRFLPAMARAELLFCTPMSEPNAGSDLLGLQTRAIPQGDGFVLRGQKVWSTGAFLSDWGMTLARTDPEAPRHQGITAFLVDLRSPGVTVRPIADGSGHLSFTEVFYDDVKVPGENVLGGINRGIPMMFDALEGDRLWARCVRASGSQRDLEDLIAYARQTDQGREALRHNPTLRHSLANMAVEIHVCRLLTYRAVCLIDQGKTLVHEASIMKTFADELGQRMAQVAMQLLGAHGLLAQESRRAPFNGRFAYQFVFRPGLTIAGGTSEIQRSTIATRGLGLPRG
ncbi:MAG: acyl-CoA dehydrogenase family protein [Chloroflexi bacterium]|nr:acyl-CoA dehydrogenase family protein [Chloroflexota bacterium]